MKYLDFEAVRFCSISIASGAGGFNGEGYAFHRYWKRLGLTHAGCEFTSKSTGMRPRKGPHRGGGNMLMKDDGITPAELFPRCIYVQPTLGCNTLNAVGLTGPGAPALVPQWRIRTGRPWWISFASPSTEWSEQCDELREFVDLLSPDVHQWAAPVGLELNFSCPNKGDIPVTDGAFAAHVHQCLEIVAELPIPTRCKFNALLDVGEALAISLHPRCYGFVMGNTLPWGAFSDRIPWWLEFGEVSPLIRRGFTSPGGLSGPYLLGIHCDWISRARMAGIRQPIWGCGGIMSKKDVEKYRNAGANAVMLGTVAIHRPWRMREIIRHAQTYKPTPSFDLTRIP